MKTIAYVYSIGGPPVDYFYPKLASRGRVCTYIVTPPSAHNRSVIDRFSAQVVDFSDLPPAQALHAVYEHAKLLRPDALFAFAEFVLKGVSDVARQLGLSGVGDNVDHARNKLLMRSRWHERGLPQPKFVPIKSAGDIAATRELKPPFIVKVAYGAGSIGQQIAASHDDTRDCVERVVEVVHAARKTGDHEFSEDDAFPMLIAEEVIESTTEGWYDEAGYGDFVSVEGIVRDGVYHPLAMTGRLKTVPPFTELGNLAPCTLSRGQKLGIVDIVREAIDTLGLEDCATHTELKLKRNGEIALLETAARMGGVGIALELFDVFGLDFIDLFVSVLLREPCRLPAFEEVEPRCGAASVAMIGCNSLGAPWTSRRVFRTEGIDWRRLIGCEGEVDVLASQSLAQGTPFPVYDFASGVLNYAGQAYLRTPKARNLKEAAYRIVDGLEFALPIDSEGRNLFDLQMRLSS